MKKILLAITASVMGLSIALATDFTTAPVKITNKGHAAISLSTMSSANYAYTIKRNATPTEDTQAIGDWIWGDDDELRYTAATDTYGGSATKVNRRGVIRIINDSKATQGLIKVAMDYTLGAGDYVTLELYGWNSGETSVGLSWGGPKDGTAWNQTIVGDATALLSQTYTTGTSLSELVDLGTGYDYYAWRVGRSAGNDDLGNAGQTTFSGLSVTLP
ncbi:MULTISPECIES: hypothetical protein [unclassified Lentimonas]|uniref:hypothetical protein n=1 Tax=unclassified Lentimonas TaxID=2630993 RepID=UPI00132500C5|nr:MULTISPECIES: hypothetical protein [unclassified Lentimonas]CAA6679795.1 Unannotated [Lentimonas sp. CC4]CAA6685694.1 Unannotated [Lentimonas sp. CC6]CAA7077137.1 Unannotated [Lentimonas sp. CC4]CAA7168781.1 Unannotated [Lentimonas sp. CC21]CAA7180853.1 Unannotated [Lentimonas sp. CC8]